ncbi:IS5 family transposase [Candidatus Woesearchaeota archaeon]|nr:IS5 family transposase [Candidatus Woesearchaeota archaeon]
MTTDSIIFVTPTPGQVTEVESEEQTKFTDDERIIEIPPEDKQSPRKSKPTYPQNWQAYNAAKTNEDTYFKRLLRELLFVSIDEKPSKKPGRKGYSDQDKIFAMCIKIYYKGDLRKAEGILKELKNLKFIEKVPCFKSIDNFFNDETLTKILDNLILISALPLAQIEETGAIDSTGFSTSQFESWNTFKWGKHEGKERVWRKAHACTCCKTNAFLSIKVTEKNVGDAAMFNDVVGNYTKYFNMPDFVADKAYLSRDILKTIKKLGMNPYIPFKKNSIQAAKGAMIWSQMYAEFMTNREEFMQKYHRRSNIETSFHMLKMRFGNHCMTRTFHAQTNEIKIKTLCLNLCILIQEMFERQIVIDFNDCVNLCNNEESCVKL